MSVPADTDLTGAYELIDAVVKTLALESYNAVAYKLPPTPTPPAIVNAPVVVPVLTVVDVMLIGLLVEDPLVVTDCNVPVFHTVTTPVDVLTDVSVPEYNFVTPPPGLNWV
jgi:hypothetical protein